MFQNVCHLPGCWYRFAQVVGPDTFARRYLSPTQWDFYGLGVTHQNTFAGSSVQHLLSVYCHFWPRRDATKVVAVVVVMLLWPWDEMPSPHMLTLLHVDCWSWCCNWLRLSLHNGTSHHPLHRKCCSLTNVKIPKGCLSCSADKMWESSDQREFGDGIALIKTRKFKSSSRLNKNWNWQ